MVLAAGGALAAAGLGSAAAVALAEGVGTTMILAKWKTFALAATLVATLAGGAAVMARQGSGPTAACPQAKVVEQPNPPAEGDDHQGDSGRRGGTGPERGLGLRALLASTPLPEGERVGRPAPQGAGRRREEEPRRDDGLLRERHHHDRPARARPPATTPTPASRRRATTAPRRSRRSRIASGSPRASFNREKAKYRGRAELPAEPRRGRDGACSTPGSPWPRPARAGQAPDVAASSPGRRRDRPARPTRRCRSGDRVRRPGRRQEDQRRAVEAGLDAVRQRDAAGGDHQVHQDGDRPSKDFEQGLPIYVDPAGLQEAEKTMDSPDRDQPGGDQAQDLAPPGPEAARPGLLRQARPAHHHQPRGRGVHGRDRPGLAYPAGG